MKNFQCNHVCWGLIGETFVSNKNHGGFEKEKHD